MSWECREGGALLCYVPGVKKVDCSLQPMAAVRRVGAVNSMFAVNALVEIKGTMGFLTWDVNVRNLKP